MKEIKRYYYDNGKIRCEIHLLNDTYHREDGPAIIQYYPDGRIQFKFYYLNDREVTDELQLIVLKGLEKC